MKLLILISFLYLNPLEGKGQPLSGTYSKSDRVFTEALEFYGDSVKFLLYYGCCIVQEIKGSGKWMEKDGKIFIAPYFPENINQITKLHQQQKDSLHFKIVTSDSINIPGASVLFINKNRTEKNNTGMASNQFGQAVCKINGLEKFDSVKISALGYQPFTFKLETGYDFIINLTSGYGKEYYDEILNTGKGLKIKVKKDKLFVRRLIFIDHTKKFAWVTFTKQ